MLSRLIPVSYPLSTSSVAAALLHRIAQFERLHPRKLGSICLTVCVALVLCAGCSRRTYRKWADQDAYRLVESRQTEQIWETPPRTVEPARHSRLADHNDPDCGPLPPDDPAANGFMRRPYNSRKEIEFWNRRGYLRTIDNGSWDQQLPLNADGELELDQYSTVQMALLNSRDYQDQVENLYATALVLSGNQFEFDLNWFGGSDTGFLANSDGMNAVRNLGIVNQLGAVRNLAAGGQFATSLVNSFTWQLGGAGPANFSAGNILFSLTQPLLRGAFRHVRTESLTQAERNLLYAVRDFSRFRRQFYFENVSRYLNLLNQAQSVLIEQDNLKNLELNLEEHNVLLEQGIVSPIQVDQVFQEYQLGRLSLINSQQTLQTALDQFKFDIGLPARIKLKLDESILQPFTLNSPEIEKLQKDIEELGQSLVEYLPPEVASDDFLETAYERIKQYSNKIQASASDVREENQQLDDLLSDGPANDSEAEKIDFDQKTALVKRMTALLDDLESQNTAAAKQYQSALNELKISTDDDDREDAGEDAAGDQPVGPQADAKQRRVLKWKKLQNLIAQPGGLKDRVNSLFVAQTQIRLFLIEIKPLELNNDRAVEIALANRLDLMNNKAFVVDAYRQVEVAADQLQSDLSVTASANLQTDSDRDNAFRLDSRNNQYNLGLQFDGPLNRFNQRNSWRLAELNYQRTRRQYMAVEDAIVNQIRLDLRQLQTNRFSFQIARQQLITATRQVEETQFSLRAASTGDSSVTQDLLQALQLLRNAKTNLISSWIQYEISRIAIFADLELLQLDLQGNWINEQEDFKIKTATDNARPRRSDASRANIDDRIDQPAAIDSSNRPQHTPENTDGTSKRADQTISADPVPRLPKRKRLAEARVGNAPPGRRAAGNLFDLR